MHSPYLYRVVWGRTWLTLWLWCPAGCSPGDGRGFNNRGRSGGLPRCSPCGVWFTGMTWCFTPMFVPRGLLSPGGTFYTDFLFCLVQKKEKTPFFFNKIDIGKLSVSSIIKKILNILLTGFWSWFGAVRLIPRPSGVVLEVPAAPPFGTPSSILLDSNPKTASAASCIVGWGWVSPFASMVNPRMDAISAAI